MNSLWEKKQFMYKAPHFLSLINFAQYIWLFPIYITRYQLMKNASHSQKLAINEPLSTLVHQLLTILNFCLQILQLIITASVMLFEIF